MTEWITPRQFHQADGVDDWRVVAHGTCAHFRTGSFATGVKLVDAIGELADAANHHPDVDVRYAGVTVRLITHDIDGLSERDVELARQSLRSRARAGRSRRPGRHAGHRLHDRRARPPGRAALLAGSARVQAGG